MTILFLISDLFLLICALLLARRSYTISEQKDQLACMVISLASVFIACSAASALLIQQPDQDLQTLRRMLENLAFFAGIPFIASAFIDIAWKGKWSKPAWGRWLLALFALFEVTRRADFGAQYSQIMATITVIALFVSFIKTPSPLARVYGIAASLFFAASLLAFSQGSLIPFLQNSVYGHILLGIALLLLSRTLQKSTL